MLSTLTPHCFVVKTRALYAEVGRTFSETDSMISSISRATASRSVTTD